MNEKYRLKTAALILFSILLLSGCSAKNTPVETPKITTKTVKKIVLVKDESGATVSKSGIENNLSSVIANAKTDSLPTVKNSSNIFFRYTGLPADKETVSKQGFTAVVLNDELSRPQSGIINADIVYEIPTGINTTSYIGVFQSKKPTDIGPIGNTTSAINNIVKELNLPLISSNVTQDVQSINPKDSKSVFYDNTTKKSPYNQHINIEKLDKYFETKKFSTPSDFAIKFTSPKELSPLLINATMITIKPTANTVSNFEYRVNKYIKRINNEVDRDFDSYDQISVDNIVVQFTDIIENQQGVTIRQEGKGRALLFCNGKVQEAYWEKDKSTGTILKDEKGNKLTLVNGKTWWYLLDSSKSVEHKFEYNSFEY